MTASASAPQVGIGSFIDRDAKQEQPEKTKKLMPQVTGTLIFALLLLIWLVLVMDDRTAAPTIFLSSIIVLAVLAVGIFPLTYLAYRNNQEPAQKARVKDDFRFLGLADEALLEVEVDKLFLNVYSPTQFYIFAGLVSLLTLAMGIAYLTHIGSPYGALVTMEEGLPANPGIDAKEVYMIFAAFLGAYLFAIQELVRRYNTFDLLPQVYSSIFVRMVVATSIVGIATSLISINAGETPLAYIVAFLIGYFPQRGIDWLSERGNSILSTQQRPSSIRPLDTIIGISNWHKARLLEMGIDDAQNLATIDIRKLLLTTQFDTQAIVNWIDQSILYVKVGEKIESLRASQLMTFSETTAAINAALYHTPDSDEDKKSQEKFIAGLLKMLGLAEPAELQRLTEAGNYPNYFHIMEYYQRSVDAVQRRAEAGSRFIFNDDLPLLNMEIQPDQSEDIPPIKDLNDAINKMFERISINPKESKFYQALGFYQQQLVKQLRKELASIPNDKSDKVASVELQERIDLNLAGAKKAFDRAVELAPKDCEAYMRRAAYRLYTEDFRGAIEDSAQALRLDPANDIAYNYRGLAHTSLGYQDLAMSDFTRALNINDCLGEAYMNRGTLYIAASRFDEAIEDMNHAYLCGYRAPALFARWGKALCSQAKWEKAIERLSQAIALDAKTAWPYADRGFAYMNLERYRDAENDLLNAIRLDPQDVIARDNLGRLYVTLKRYEEAVAVLEAAIALAPTAPTVNASRISLAYAYLSLKQYTAAITQYGLVIATTPDHHVAHIHLALAYHGDGQMAKAKEELDYVLAHAAPESEEHKLAEQMRQEGVGAAAPE